VHSLQSTGHLNKHQGDFIAQLKERLQAPLPGRAAQYKMANFNRIRETDLAAPRPDSAKVACVLNLLHESNGKWHTTLIRRTVNPKDRHSGQISFPGGRYEEQDPSLEMVALREAEEEIGTPIQQIEILGQLTELYIPVSNFVVHPFVGVYHGTPTFQAQEDEVDKLLTPALDVFTSPAIRQHTNMNLPDGRILKEVPYFAIEGEIVWGATAMILSEFLEVLGM
jgi:8-oxo-dGTP pyrophosphatase MutT (NUDIX family)